MARSYGYDPLGLSAKGGKDDVEKYRAYELIHARWAMLGALGAIVPEALNANGANLPGAVWWQVRWARVPISKPWVMQPLAQLAQHAFASVCLSSRLEGESLRRFACCLVATFPRPAGL